MEIIFRGKREDNGEWIYGSIVSFEDGRKSIMPSKAKVFRQQKTTTICCNECYDVDSATVGQFTGMYDKGNRKIFAGDILDYGFSTVVTVEYIKEQGRFAGRKGNSLFPLQDEKHSQCFRVLGNIFDNPELMEC